MSKKDTQNTSLTSVETALQSLSNGVSEENFAKMFYVAEEYRLKWAAAGTLFGIYALAMKPLIGHGKYLKWLGETLEKYAPKNEGKVAEVCHFEKKNPVRTARLYNSMARKFIAQVQNPHENSKIGKRIVEYCSNNELQESDLPALLSSGESLVDFVEFVARGRSVESFLNELNEANGVALAEEEAEKLAGKKGDIDGLKGKPTPQDPQMLLWDDWNNEFENIEKLIRHNQAVRLDPEKWLAIENTMEAQLEEIRKITAGFKAGRAKKRK